MGIDALCSEDPGLSIILSQPIFYKFLYILMKTKRAQFYQVYAHNTEMLYKFLTFHDIFTVYLLLAKHIFFVQSVKFASRDYLGFSVIGDFLNM